MRLVIGGYAQGKLDYVIKKYDIDEKNVFDYELPSKEDLESKLGSTIVINTLHRIIKKRIKEGGRPEEEERPGPGEKPSEGEQEDGETS